VLIALAGFVAVRAAFFFKKKVAKQKAKQYDESRWLEITG